MFLTILVLPHNETTLWTIFFELKLCSKKGQSYEYFGGLLMYAACSILQLFHCSSPLQKLLSSPQRIEIFNSSF